MNFIIRCSFLLGILFIIQGSALYSTIDHIEDYSLVSMNKDVSMKIRDVIRKESVDINALRERPAVVLLGNTRAGKSTVFDSLLGKKLYCGFDGVRIGLYHSREEIEQLDEADVSFKPGTLSPKLANESSLTYNLIDMPGFEDGRGIEEELVNQYFYRKVVIGRLCKFVYVVDYNQLTGNVGRFINQLRSLYSFFNEGDDGENWFDSIYFVLNHIRNDMDQAYARVKASIHPDTGILKGLHDEPGLSRMWSDIVNKERFTLIKSACYDEDDIGKKIRSKINERDLGLKKLLTDRLITGLMKRKSLEDIDKSLKGKVPLDIIRELQGFAQILQMPEYDTRTFIERLQPGIENLEYINLSTIGNRLREDRLIGGINFRAMISAHIRHMDDQYFGSLVVGQDGRNIDFISLRGLYQQTIRERMIHSNVDMIRALLPNTYRSLFDQYLKEKKDSISGKQGLCDEKITGYNLHSLQVEKLEPKILEYRHHILLSSDTEKLGSVLLKLEKLYESIELILKGEQAFGVYSTIEDDELRSLLRELDYSYAILLANNTLTIKKVSELKILEKQSANILTLARCQLSVIKMLDSANGILRGYLQVRGSDSENNTLAIFVNLKTEEEIRKKFPNIKDCDVQAFLKLSKYYQSEGAKILVDIQDNEEKIRQIRTEHELEAPGPWVLRRLLNGLQRLCGGLQPSDHEIEESEDIPDNIERNIDAIFDIGKSLGQDYQLTDLTNRMAILKSGFIYEFDDAIKRNLLESIRYYKELIERGDFSDLAEALLAGYGEEVSNTILSRLAEFNNSERFEYIEGLEILLSGVEDSLIQEGIVGSTRHIRVGREVGELGSSPRVRGRFVPNKFISIVRKIEPLLDGVSDESRLFIVKEYCKSPVNRYVEFYRSISKDMPEDSRLLYNFGEILRNDHFSDSLDCHYKSSKLGNPLSKIVLSGVLEKICIEFKKHLFGINAVEDKSRAVTLYSIAEETNINSFITLYMKGLLFYLGAPGYEINREKAVHLYRIGVKKAYPRAQSALGYAYNLGEAVEKDLAEAVRLYRLAADQGLASAQSNLGIMYSNGEGVSQDKAEAVRWYRKAADQGYASAQYNLGVMYDNGEGVSQDKAEAVHWYFKAADQGHASAQFNLRVMYDNGEGVEKDLAEAVRLYRKAADQEDASAQFNLGSMYYNGTGVSQDKAEAVRWYRKAADQGYASAKFNLGVMYSNGEGVSQDKAEAVCWYRKAADQGYASAQSNLGFMYSNGEGVAQNKAEAVRWYRKAADQEVASAQSNLGIMYSNGEGVSQDKAEAVRWYRKAADQGYASAQYNLGFMYSNGEGVSQDKAEAVCWYRKAADQGYASAQSNLGFMYSNGEGVAQNKAEAVRWYRKAADQGHASAQFNLGFMYEYGKGVEKDLAEAVRLYRLAADQGICHAIRALSHL